MNENNNFNGQNGYNPNQNMNMNPNVAQNPVLQQTPMSNVQPDSMIQNGIGQPMNNYMQNNQMPNMNSNNFNYQQQPIQNRNGGSANIIIAILAVVIIVLGGFIAWQYLKDDDKAGNNDDVAVVDKTVTVRGLGYTFKVPENISTQTLFNNSKETLYMTSDTEDWEALLEVGDVVYSNIVSKKAQVKTNFANRGIYTEEFTTKKFGGKEFLYATAIYSGNTLFCAYTEAKASQSFSVTLMNNANSVDSKPFETIGKILLTATKDSTSSSMMPELPSASFDDLLNEDE